MASPSYDNSWALTVPVEQRPSIELPVFSDDPLALSEYAIKYGRAAQDLANYALAFAAEASVMQGRGPEEVRAAVVAGKLTVVGLAFFENDPATPDAPTELRVVRMDSLRHEEAGWSCKLAIANDEVQIAVNSLHTTQAGALFHRDAGGCTPRQLWYAQQHAGRPYIAERHSTDFSGLISYEGLARDYHLYNQLQPHEIIEPLRLLYIAQQYMSGLISPPVQASVRVATQTSA